MKEQTEKPTPGRAIPWLETLLIVSLLSLLTQVFYEDIKRWYQSPRPGEIGIDLVSTESLTESSRSSMSDGYLAYLPKSYNRLKEFPLVIFLHGSGRRGSDPLRLKDLAIGFSRRAERTPNFIVLIPQCMANKGWHAGDISRFVDFANKKYKIDQKRIYLVGYSMGAYGAWSAGAKYPDLFSAIVPIAGGGEPENASTLTNLPIWAFHGDGDKVVEVEGTLNMVKAIREKGGNPKMTIFGGKGHNVCGKALKTKGLWNWLLQQSLDNR